MFKKTITFEDFNGNELTEDFYFHLSKGELVELELGADGGMSEYLKKIVGANDRQAIVKEFKKIILMSYGVRSSDGRRFIKDEQNLLEFTSTNAYSELFTELATNDGAAAEFIRNLIPANLADGLPNTETVELPEDTRPDWIKEDREPTDAELRKMSPEEMREAFRRRMQK